MHHQPHSIRVDKGCYELIEPVYNLHCKEVLNTDYLGVDETTIKVLDKDKKGISFTDTTGCITIQAGS
ncbi:MAG: hypothetical protein M9959_15825 [Chitinophagaceae bacterium]|nr:hypothetical protein [Chitinophagaceae bacterium]